MQLRKEKIRLGLLSRLVRALHRYRRGQGSNPGKPDFFRLSFCNCISCVNNCEDLLYIYFKHILLSYGVKTLTENVELIQMLNRLGHDVSYSQLENNDTALCLQKMAANLNQKLVLPGTI